MKISIMGCGWFGFPLAEKLISEGWQVNGSTTRRSKTKKLHNAGIIPFVLDFNESKYSRNLSEFLNAQILLINIPPTPVIVKGKAVAHQEQLKQIIDELMKSTVKKVIYISSTSVYRNTNEVVEENEKYYVTKGRGYELLTAEKMLREKTRFQTTVLRFAGLYGYSRVPLRKSKESLIIRDNNPMNLLHLDDAVKIAAAIIKNDMFGNTYNVCQDDHPTREEFVKANPIVLEGRKLVLDIQPAKYKIVSNKKIKQDLSVEFRQGFKL